MPVLEKYSVASRFFHWVSALLLIVVWFMIVLAEQASGREQAAMYMGYHKALGVSLGAFIVARLINRALSKAPAPVAMPKWQHILAAGTHILLYLLLLIQPIAGVLMSLYSGRDVSVFGLFSIPAAVQVNDAFADWLNELHTSILWPMIWLFTLVHIVGALYHQLVQKDGTLRRML